MMKPQKKKKTPVGQMQAGGPTKQAPRRPAGKLPPAGTGGNALQAQKKQAQMLGRPSRRPARSPLSAQKAQVAATGGKRTAAQQQRRKARLASMTPAQRQRRKANMKTLQGMTPAQRRQRRPVGRRK